MPRGDKTGPEGNGPLTGRRMGNCVSNENFISPNNQNFGRGLGRGFAGGRGYARGFGRGFGRGSGFFGNQNYQNTTDKNSIENEINALKEQISFLEKQISDSK